MSLPTTWSCSEINAPLATFVSLTVHQDKHTTLTASVNSACTATINSGPTKTDLGVSNNGNIIHAVVLKYTAFGPIGACYIGTQPCRFHYSFRHKSLGTVCLDVDRKCTQCSPFTATPLMKLIAIINTNSIRAISKYLQPKFNMSLMPMSTLTCQLTNHSHITTLFLSHFILTCQLLS